jgi:hypothetical protein
MAWRRKRCQMAKDDSITIRPRDGIAVVVLADKQGRKVEGEFQKDGGVNWYVAKLLTRGGTLVFASWVPTDQIVSIEKRIKGDD